MENLDMRELNLLIYETKKMAQELASSESCSEIIGVIQNVPLDDLELEDSKELCMKINRIVSILMDMDKSIYGEITQNFISKITNGFSGSKYYYALVDALEWLEGKLNN